MIYKVLMVVAKDDFRDEEFKGPFEVFMREHIRVRVASTEVGKCTGAYGMTVRSDYAFSDFQEKSKKGKNPEDRDLSSYHALIIVGGFGAKNLENLEELRDIINYFAKNDKIVSAICYSPVILAKSGVMKGKKSTVWNEDGNQEPVLKENGVDYVGDSIVIDGNFITARDYNSAVEFGETLAKAVKELANKS